MHGLAAIVVVSVGIASAAFAQEPAAWGDELVFHTFSIAAVDPETGESGVAVTTRNPCVGNGVPWVRAGVGAVATQASTRTDYGNELLDFLEQGLDATKALAMAVAADENRDRRQVGVIGLDGGSAQHTGEGTNPWTGHRAGTNYVTQGNSLVGPTVLEAVARSFETTDADGRHLADRLVAALEAGQNAGGDARKGRMQSAAVIVADPRPAHSRRRDGVSTHINVCEHPTPVAELRRIYDNVSQTLGYRMLQQFRGRDVFQLKLMLHALGYYRKDVAELEEDDQSFYTVETVAAVEAFRAFEGLSTASSGSPAGLVDQQTVDALWTRLEAAGRAGAVRARVKALTAITR